MGYWYLVEQYVLLHVVEDLMAWFALGQLDQYVLTLYGFPFFILKKLTIVGFFCLNLYIIILI